MLNMILVMFLLTSPLFASESECLVSSFSGADGTLEDAVFQQLKTELKVPIYKDKGPASCSRLVIVVQDKASRISIERGLVHRSTVQLDGFLPALWPRAIALSTSGLWVLARGSERTTPMSTPADKDSPPGDKKKLSEKQEHRDAALPQTDRPHFGVRLHLLIGVRWMPQLNVSVFEMAPGIGVLFSAVYFDLSFLGLWGRKSLDSNKIITSGGGGRITAFWRALNRNVVSLGLGPSVEVLGIYGYGQGREDVVSYRELYPVVNLLLLSGVWWALTTRTTMRAVIGGGWSVVHFNMQRDGETVSGITGGSINIDLGVSFGP